MDFDPSKDYYKILEVDENASSDEIKKSFRKLAMQYHPDKKWWDKEKFQAINEAHGVLWDAQKKQQYDMMRKHWWGVGWMGWFWGFGGFWSASGFEVDLGDVMDQFFGWGRARSTSWPRPWEDIQVDISISFEESYTGTEKTISYTRKQKLEGLQEETCETCQGSWRISQQSHTIFWVMQTQTICPTCHGVGKLYKKDWKTFPGWVESQKETIDITIPEGIKDGVYIRHSGKWDDGIAGGGTGDLYVKVNVKPSKIYTRKGNDIYITQDVSIFHLVLGWELTIPHPDGEKTVKIPKGTQVSDKIKINKLGFASKWVFNARWDLYVVPRLSIPKKLSKAESKLRSELQKLS